MLLVFYTLPRRAVINLKHGSHSNDLWMSINVTILTPKQTLTALAEYQIWEAKFSLGRDGGQGREGREYSGTRGRARNLAKVGKATGIKILKNLMINSPGRKKREENSARLISWIFLAVRIVFLITQIWMNIFLANNLFFFFQNYVMWNTTAHNKRDMHLFFVILYNLNFMLLLSK